MKYLSDYTQEAHTKLLEETGTFYAFSDQQFEEQKKPDIKYVSLWSGTICPKDQVENYINWLHEITQAWIKMDIAENGIEWVIRRELWNHEAYYTWEIDDTCDALEPYGITREQIYKVFRNQNALVS